MVTKTLAQHTPGPWHVAQGSDSRDFIVAEPTGNTVCEPNIEAFHSPADFDPSIRRIGLTEAKANARLMAAAPGLLNAARLALAEYAARTWSDPAHPSSPAQALKAAIANAEGAQC